MSSPEARWRAAVARSPLESPRAFPGRLLPLVRALTGGTSATYTSGPATRSALAAAGARGATTRTTVHLSAEPDRSDVGVLAHELSHARSPVLRPRFSLRVPGGAPDTDERVAQATGAAMRRAITDGSGDLRGLSGFSGLASSLPVGGATAGATALVDAATRAARDVVRDEVERALATMDRTAARGAADLPSPGGDHAFQGGAPTERSLLPAESGTATASGVAAAPGGQAPGGHPPGGPVQTDRQPSTEQIVRAIEERVLHQLERRGGRYAGIF
ncbi:DUF4157 domain-containing protein [Streptomyces sp. NRRL S-118]|uniref:DUF4157 domain-containing protein n=1 Tax=Streptomyces sp. NRRL S-118 TaxID=1463881 RepID=UPI0004CB198F|nr:DUF4157 domain-containing protein [Streptomyces sp. NRRL S-118]